MDNVIFRPAPEWPIIDERDVVVVGAGPAGIAAAVAAARLGPDTLIVEKCGFPGGVATTACCPYLMGFCAGGRQVVGGVADELVRELAAMGQARFVVPPEDNAIHVELGSDPVPGNVVTSVEAVRVAANRLLARSGVTRLYYTTLIGAVVEGRTVSAIAVDRIDGPGLIRAKAFVDATGDANLVWRAGGERREYSVQDSMTKTLLMRVGGVAGFKSAEMKSAFGRAVTEGRIPLKGQDRLMGKALLNPGEVLLNFTLTAGDGVRAKDLTRMDTELREQALTTVEWFRREMPGFEKCHLVETAAQVGVRAGRGIVGRETITTADLDQGAPVPEPVAIGSRGYGGHGPDSFQYAWGRSNPGLRGVPWGTLLPVSFDNITAGGRAISCECRAISSIRLMARCMATGQAAGVTAALVAREGAGVGDLNYESVRDVLLEQGAILE